MGDVFISYAREDRALAEALARDLEASGTAVWWDAELVGSDDFQEVILTALSQAKAAIVIWTKASVKSLFVRDEARFALHYRKLVAVKDPGLEVIEIPFGFQNQHTDSIGDREQIFRAIQKLGVKARTAARPSAVDTGWERVRASTSVDEVLAWLEKNPTDPSRQEAIQRVRDLIAQGGSGDGSAGGAGGSAFITEATSTSSPAKLVRTSNFSAFLSGLTFRVPSFQLSTQGTWSSIGFAIGFLFMLAIGVVLWVMTIGAMARQQQSDTTILPVAIGLLALISTGTWLRFSSWATQRNFVAAYIVLPFFLVLTALLGICLSAYGKALNVGDDFAVLIFYVTAILAIGAVVWKIRAVR